MNPIEKMVAAGLYDWLLLLHLLGAMVWLGGLAILTVLVTLALRSRDPQAISRFVQSLRVVGPATFVPSMAAVLGFGIWMVVHSDAWDFDQTWIQIAFGLFAAAFLVGAVFQSRSAIGAQRALEAGEHGEAARRLRTWAWGGLLILVLLVVVTWDMVFKPGV